jgi:hypothetical protein
VYASTSPPVLRAALACVARGAAASGRALGDLDVALWAPMSIGRDRDVARDHVRGRVASALRHPLPVELPEADRAAIARLRAGYDAFEHATAASRHRELVPDRFVDLMALAGTPAEIVEQVRAIAREVRRSAGSSCCPRCRGTTTSGATRSSGCSPTTFYPTSSRSFGAVYSIAGTVIQVASAFGPALYGVARDALGGYPPVLGMAAGLEVAALVVVLAGRPRRNRTTVLAAGGST